MVRGVGFRKDLAAVVGEVRRDEEVQTAGWSLAKEYREYQMRIARAREGLSKEDILAVGPSAVVDASEAYARLKRSGQVFDWSDVIRTQLAAYGHEAATDGLIEICRRIAQGYAEAAILEARQKMDKEKAEQAATLKPLLDVMREFMQMTEGIGPFDEIVGVAIKGPDGAIRVVGKT